MKRPHEMKVPMSIAVDEANKIYEESMSSEKNDGRFNFDISERKSEELKVDLQNHKRVESSA